MTGRRQPPLVDEELADQLLGRAQAVGVELLGPGVAVPGDQGGAPCTHRGVIFDSGHAFYGVLDCAVLGWLGTKRPTI